MTGPQMARRGGSSVSDCKEVVSLTIQNLQSSAYTTLPTSRAHQHRHHTSKLRQMEQRCRHILDMLVYSSIRLLSLGSTSSSHADGVSFGWPLRRDGPLRDLIRLVDAPLASVGD